MDPEKRLRVLAALVDGNSERAVERMTGVGRQTISRFALRLGQGAEWLHNRLARDLSCSLIEVDEVWSYVGKKQARLTPKDSPDFGDAYLYTALDASSRMIISYRVGKRDQKNTDAFIADLRSRLLVMPQITSDGWSCYPSAIGAKFGPGVAYAQMHKVFRASGVRDDDYRREQPRNPIVSKHPVLGMVDMAKVSTSYAERQNGTQRHITGRIRRFVYAFSKSLEHHRAAVSLGYAWYNLGHVVRTLRVTPAVQAGVTGHVWGLDEFMDAVLSEPAAEVPTAKPVGHRVPEGPARELPDGRGFLRLVPPLPPTTTVPSPEPSPPPTPAQAPTTGVAPGEDRQRDQGAPRPKLKPAPPCQLTLLDYLDRLNRPPEGEK